MRTLFTLALLATSSFARTPADEAYQIRGQQEDFDYINGLPSDQQHEALKRLRAGEPRPGGSRHPSPAHTRSIVAKGDVEAPKREPKASKPMPTPEPRKASCSSPPKDTAWWPPADISKGAASDASLSDRAERIEAMAEAALSMLARYYGAAADNVLNRSWVLQPSGVAEWATAEAPDSKDEPS